VNKISINVEECLCRHGVKSPKADTPPADSQVRYTRDFKSSYPRVNTCGRVPPRGRARYNSGPRAGPHEFCPLCNYLAKTLQLNIDFSHLPVHCPRKQSTLRLLKLEEQELEEHGEFQEESAQSSDQGEVQDSIYHEGKQFIDHSCPNNINAIWKAKSPTLLASINESPVSVLIDEGSEISAINYHTAQNLHIPISRTLEMANSAGSLALPVKGQTTQDVLLTVPSSSGNRNTE